MNFALLLGTVKDGQTLRPVSCLGGTAIMAQLGAIEQISRHTRFYWTGARLSDLNGLVAEGKIQMKLLVSFTLYLRKFRTDGQNSLHPFVARHEVDQQLI
jgi:hypothetical protein